MNMRPPFRPFEDVAEPFRIGLSPLDPAHMLLVDDRRDRELALKRRLWTEERDAVFVAEADTQDAQAAVADLVVANLVEHHGLRVALDDIPPLAAAALVVQEDLLVMRRATEGWRLVAGSLSFPSSWSLAQKFGRTLHSIHEPVPGVNARMDVRIARMFDHMRVPLWRQNWSLQNDDALRVVREEGERGGHDNVGDAGDGNGNGDGARGLRLRMEYQTLTRLPSGPPPGDLLFTVRILLDPLEALANRRRLAAGLLERIGAMSEAERGYKGLAPRLADLRTALRRIAEAT